MDLLTSGVDFVQFVGLAKDFNEETEAPSKQQISRKSSIASTNVSCTSNSVSEASNEIDVTEDKGIEMEESSKGKVKGSVYLHYFTAGAHWSILVALAFSFLFVQVLASGADYWVSVW